jgi:DNA-binding CsgD family transcriptional regulator
MFITAPGMLPCNLIINYPRRSLYFNDQIYPILEFIKPHLSNYYSILKKMSEYQQEQCRIHEMVYDGRLLSKREAEIAVLLCQHLTMVEIATKLLLSPRTVQTHVENIKEKLRVRNRREMLLKLTGANTNTKLHSKVY